MNTLENDTTDLELHQLRRRQAAATERWFLRYADPVYTFVYYRVGRDPDLATELVQETFLTALRKIDQFDPGRGSMLTWLTLLSKNCVRAALRQRGRYKTHAELWDRIDERLVAAFRQIDQSPLPDQALEQQETVELVQMALANLPDGYREALKQHYCEQRSLQQIASSRGTTEGAIKSLLHRARLAFKAAVRTLSESLHEDSSGWRVTS
jgi:RNA polymerase sigma-70 factor (ECF subfamily)